MSLFRSTRADTPTSLLNARTWNRSVSTRVSTDKSLTHSAVWACRRLRGDLISTMPVDVFRRVNGVQTEVARPPVLTKPDGKIGLIEWLYSTQGDLDSSGNTFGLIKARDGRGLPAAIELVPIDSVTVISKSGEVSYRIGNDTFTADEIWHERQFTTSGSPVGMSPTAYAAASMSAYLSAQDFTRAWFSGSGIPAAMFRNKAKTLTRDQTDTIKAQWDETIQNGGLLVTGQDWEYEMIAAKASEATAIESLQWGVTDACRYFGVPGDAIDAVSPTGSITYANITQWNLKLLIHHLGPAITRREDALSQLTAQPRYVKLNPGALLRMDTEGRYAAHKVAIDGRFMAPSEVRELENRQPFTPEQEAEFARLFPAKSAPIGATP